MFCAKFGTGRSGLIYGVLSNAKEWRFIMIDGDGVASTSPRPFETPDKPKLGQVCRIIYRMLHEGLVAERSFGTTGACELR